MQYSAYYSPSTDKIVLVTTFNDKMIGISDTMDQWRLQELIKFINSDYEFLGLV